MMKRKRKHTSRKYAHEKYSGTDNPRKNIFALWVLRALIYLKGNKKFIRKHGFRDDDILRIIGLFDLANTQTIKDRHAKKLTESRLIRLESKEIKQPKDILYKNIEWLGKTLSLTKVDKDILIFSILVSTISNLQDGLNTIENVDKVRLYHCISVILDIPIEDCKKSLNNNSILISTGLIRIEHDESQLGDKMSIINTLIESIFEDYSNQQDILNKFFDKSPAPKLEEIDFQHLKSDSELMNTYLKSVTNNKTRGVNVLIYGEPGVGKTELVRLITHNMKLNLYEISMKDNGGDPISGEERFSLYQLSQKFLEKQENCCILFDEIEDVFPKSNNSFFGSSSGNSAKSSGKKAWINHILENNPIPTFWLCNEVQQIDPAYLRRFDYITELKKPTRSGRRHIINKYLGSLNMNKQWLNDIANNENITPALIERAAKIAVHISEKKIKILRKRLMSY